MNTRQLLSDAAQRAADYLDGLNARSVAPTAEAVAGLSKLNVPFPEAPTDSGRLLELLDTAGSPATTATAGGRFFGFVIGGSMPAALAANWLAAAWDQNAGSSKISPVAGRLEEVAARWLLEIFGMPPQCGVGFVTGGTMANFTALAAARHAVLQRAGWDVESRGLFGAPPVNVVVGEEAHPTLLKSLGLLGLGRDRVTLVPVDGQGRMRADALPALNQPCIVCLQAGNVNTGAFDPAATIIPAAQAAGAWVHVDGAFGLWAKAAPEQSGLAVGLEQADSLATDAHKWLNVPYDCGIALVRDAASLRAAMSISAAYLPTGEVRVPSDYTPELSRRARGVDVWAALFSLGRTGLAALIERCCRHARRFAGGLREAGFEVLNDVVLNQVLVSFGDPARTQRVIEAIQKDGTCWCGETVWQGRTAMRISVSSWATTEEEVELSLAAMIKAAASV